MTPEETVAACEQEVKDVLKKHGCVLETHTMLVNGVLREERIVAVIAPLLCK